MKKEIKSKKQIGLWMDHEKAKLIEPVTARITTLEREALPQSAIAGEQGGGSRLGNNRSTNNEFNRHNKEQDQLHAYYKELAKELMPYDEILIMGASTAHKEFVNYLVSDKHFSGKKITGEACDHLGDNVLQQKVYDFFKNEN